MPYRFLPDVALADVAFEARSDSLEGLFEECARALTDVMVDRETLRPSVERTIRVASENLDRLLYDFLTELVVIKDVESLLFKEFDVSIDRSGSSLECKMAGEEIDRERHSLRNDVKAVTMHMFGVSREGGEWRVTVVLDI